MAVEIGNLVIRGSFGGDDKDVAYIDEDKLQDEFARLRQEIFEELRELIRQSQSSGWER